jgi:hypothetical protein
VQVPGRGGEELRSGLLVWRGLGGDVDDALHACQGLRQTVPGDHVHAQGTRHPDDVVSFGLEHVDDLDALVAQIADQGVEPSKRETYSNGVRKVTYHDPDGNEIGFGGAPI